MNKGEIRGTLNYKCIFNFHYWNKWFEVRQEGPSQLFQPLKLSGKLFKNKFYLFICKTEWKSASECSSNCWFTSQILPTTRVRQAKAGARNSIQASWMRDWDSSTSAVIFCLPGCISKEGGSEVEVVLNPSTLIENADVPSSDVARLTTCLPCLESFKECVHLYMCTHTHI